MNRLSAVLVFFCLSLIPATQPAHAAVTAWMDIRIEDGNLLLETEVAGVPGLSIIDTGATGTFINANFLEAEELSFKTGQKIEVSGVYGKEKRSTYLKIPGRIFDGDVTFRNVIDLDLGEPNIQLLLGANFFANYVFQFDYTNERMRLITRDSVDMKAIKNIESKKDRDDGSVVVRVILNEDDAAWVLMDTGSNGGLLVPRRLAKRLDWIDTYPSVEGRSSGIISSAEMEYFRVPAVEVGPFKIENVLVSMPAEGERPRFFEEATQTETRFKRRKAAEGILGYDILKHFVVTIDYDRGYVHFYPGEKEASD